MSFLTLSFDKQLIFVIIYWVFEISVIVLKYFYEDYFSFPKNSIQREYLLRIINITGELLSGFLILYTKFVSKSPRMTNNIKFDKNELIFDSFHSLKKISFKKLILICLINYISR